MGLGLSLIFVWETLRIFNKDHLERLIKSYQEGSVFAFQKKVLFFVTGSSFVF